MDFIPIPVIKKEEALSIKTPITLIVSKKDIIFLVVKMMKRTIKIFHSLKNTLLLEDSKHVQNKRDNTKIKKLI
jgi:hypothetical protein